MFRVSGVFVKGFLAKGSGFGVQDVGFNFCV